MSPLPALRRAVRRARRKDQPMDDMTAWELLRWQLAVLGIIALVLAVLGYGDAKRYLRIKRLARDERPRSGL